MVLIVPRRYFVAVFVFRGIPFFMSFYVIQPLSAQLAFCLTLYRSVNGPTGFLSDQSRKQNAKSVVSVPRDCVFPRYLNIYICSSFRIHCVLELQVSE